MVMTESKMYLGIDIGGSAFKYGWGNAEQGLLSYHRLDLANNSLAAMRAATAEILQRVETALGTDAIAAIGIGSPGTINRKTGLLMGVNPNLPEWTNLLPASIVHDYVQQNSSLRKGNVHQEPQDKSRGTYQQSKTHDHWDIPVYADNDANLMALAEAHLLPHKTSVIGITVGSGIGSGFVYNGHIFHGASGFAMELGHVTVVDRGLLCNCKRSGCLEAYSAVNGMRRRIKEVCPVSRSQTMGEILQLCKYDPEANEILLEGVAHLGRAIANLVIMLDADAVILGGGVVELDGYPTQILEDIILDHLPAINKADLTIKKAEMGNSAGVMGAIILAEQSFCGT